MRVYAYPLSHGRFETWSARPEGELMHVHQTHSTIIQNASHQLKEADGIQSSYQELSLPLAIKTADCLPIVIEGETGVIHLHAGWRGLAHGILDDKNLAGIKPAKAFIGPSIRKCCFEVSPEFPQEFPGSTKFSERAGKLYFDLQGEATERLNHAFGIEVQDAEVCTVCDSRFHSYRRDRTPNRNWNLYIKE